MLKTGMLQVNLIKRGGGGGGGGGKEHSKKLLSMTRVKGGFWACAWVKFSGLILNSGF